MFLDQTKDITLASDVDIDFDFARLFFCIPYRARNFTCAPDRASKKKNRARRSQFVQPCCEPLERSCKSEPLVNCKVISSETNELYYFQPNIFWRISENISKRLSKV